MKRILNKSLVLFVLLGTLLSSGCATQAMKGTPFFTGEYSVRKGPAEDRVNVWPLLYYRDPALSVLWPIGQKTEDHFAIRPLYSVYGLDEDKKVHNVLWPIGEFNMKTGKHHIFPVYWSNTNDYFNVFPLYWHGGDPYGSKGGHDVLFPLWMIDRHKSSYDMSFLWPIINFNKDGKSSGWRVWPIVGCDKNAYRTEGYYAWPLGWFWNYTNGNSVGSALFPAYYYDKRNNGRSFYSILYCSDKSDNGNGFQMLFPLYFSKHKGDRETFATLLGGYSRKGDESSWMAFPILSGGKKGSSVSDTWIFGPLAHVGRDGDDYSSHLFPLYYKSKDGNDSSMLSIPWCSSRKKDTSWQMVPLIYFNMESKNGDIMLTPLYAAGSTSKDNGKWHAIVPLYYKRSSDKGYMMQTVLGGWYSDTGGRKWLLYPALSGGRRTEDGGEFWVIAPLIHGEWDKDSTSHHVLPLYYWNGKNNTFISPLLAGFENDDGRRTTIIPPALSWYSAGDRKSDLWFVGPLAHWSWGEDAGKKHVMPLFYSDSRKGTMISLPYSKWQQSSGRTTRMVPPLLSWATVGDKRGDFWFVGALAHWSWGEEAGSRHIFPLYYGNPDQEECLTPLWAKWKDGKTTYKAIPFLLSGYSDDGKNKEISGILNLFHQKWGEGDNKGHLIPLYFYEGSQRVITPVAGWNTNGKDKRFYPLTPLVGFRYGAHTGGWLFPLLSHKKDVKTGSYDGNFLWGSYWKDGEKGGSSFFPVYKYKNQGSYDDIPDVLTVQKASTTYGKSFVSLPYIWYRNQVFLRPDYTNSKDRKNPEYIKKHVIKHGAFPLWSSKTENIPARNSMEKNISLLCFLYDYRHESGQLTENDVVKDHDYVRSRVLWRLWHSEKLNGDLSVDVFPSITYDKKKDGFKRVSFLWKLFRYEREADGNHKLHLFFIPLMK